MKYFLKLKTKKRNENKKGNKFTGQIYGRAKENSQRNEINIIK